MGGKASVAGPSQKTCRMDTVNGLSGEKPEMPPHAPHGHAAFPFPTSAAGEPRKKGMPMPTSTLLLPVLLLTSTPALSAQPDTSRPGTLDEVVVTANRFPQKQRSTGKVVTVIPREVIERSAGLTLGDLLNRQAGIAVAGANNNAGTNPDVYLRGAATGNTLILLDGVPVYDVSTINNTFDLNHFPLDAVERIEILKGAQSTVYGSDAVAGVIHIITRRNTTQRLAADASLTAGSFGTRRAAASLRGHHRHTHAEATYSGHAADGFSTAFDTTGKGGFDRDGFRQHLLQLKGGTQIAQGLTLRAGALYGRYHTELDGSAFRDERDFTADNTNLQADAGIEWKRDGLLLQARYQQGRLERAYLDDSTHQGGFARYTRDTYRGRTGFAEAYARIRLGPKADLLAGIDTRRQDTDQDFLSISAYGPYATALARDTANIRLSAAYASLLLRNDKGLHLEAGGRWNRHTRFGSHATFTFNPSYTWHNGWQTFLNASSAFKAPSLYQLYDASVGEPSLRPETSITTEAGLRYAPDGGTLQARAVIFAREIRHGIDFNYVDYRYYNYNRQQAAGIEVEASFRKGRWDLAQNYTYVAGQVQTVAYAYDAATFSYVPKGDTTYDNLFRRPRHSLNIDAGYRASPKLTLRLAARLVGARQEPRFMAAPIRLDAYQVIDLTVEYRLHPSLRAFLDLRNLTDTRYFDVLGFSARPLHFLTGLRWSR